MGWWTDIAVRHTQTPNHGPSMNSHRGVVVHIAEGSYQGTINWQMNPDADVSSHFVVSKQGEITQMLDTDLQSWCQIDGNGDWLSVENEGFVTDGGLTAAQLSANARIFAKSNEVYGHGLAVATCPGDFGLGHHSMGAECGFNWGHSECPGEAIKAQKPEIAAQAAGEEQGGEMADSANVKRAGLFADGLLRRASSIGVVDPKNPDASYPDSDGVMSMSGFWADVESHVATSVGPQLKAINDTLAEIMAKLDALEPGTGGGVSIKDVDSRIAASTLVPPAAADGS